MEYQDLATRLRSIKDAELGSGAAQQDIEAAESELAVRLSGSYRRFLEEFGWGSIGHLEIFGLGEDVPAFLHMVRIAESERAEMIPHLPRYLVPVLNDGAGNLYCVDTERCHEDECPVVFWNHEGGIDQEPELVAPSFSIWLAGELDNLDGEFTS